MDNELCHYGKKGMKWGVRRAVDNISESRDNRKTDKIIKKYQPGSPRKLYSDKYNTKIDKKKPPKKLNKVQIKDKTRADALANNMIKRGMNEDEAVKAARTEVHLKRVKQQQRVQKGMQFVQNVMSQPTPRTNDFE